MKESINTLTMQMSEAEAIEKAQNGDVGGYEALYHMHKRQVYALCLRFSGNASDAEDLTQEVFLQVYRKISGFRGDAKFGSWIYRVAANFGLMFTRRRRLEQISLSALPETESNSASSNWGSRSSAGSLPLERVALGRALTSLPPSRMNVVLLHDIRGYTHSEVGQCLGVAAGTSRSQLYRAHMVLRSILRGSSSPVNPP
jgi:RNA polymerase sigma-70 factor (ECF subfamily)